MPFTKKQNDDLCVAAGIAPVDYIGKSVECTTCKRTKKPRGRSAPLGSSYCETECSGYYEAPLAGDLWWNETGTDFGYAFSKELATPIYPDLLTAEGFLILWRALRNLGCRVTVSTADRLGVSAYIRKGFGKSAKSYKTKNVFQAVEESLFLSACKVLKVPGV